LRVLGAEVYVRDPNGSVMPDRDRVVRWMVHNR
jgi:hypothetical protein